MVLVVVLGVVWLQGYNCCKIGILARAGKLPGCPGLRSGLVLVLSSELRDLRLGFEAHFGGWSPASPSYDFDS